jgi:hypothetical protein
MAGLAIAILGGVALFALGYNIRPVTRAPVAVPALSLPADTPAPAAGPRRIFDTTMPKGDASARPKYLAMCEASEAYYKARPDSVCTGSCADGTARCEGR